MINFEVKIKIKILSKMKISTFTCVIFHFSRLLKVCKQSSTKNFKTKLGTCSLNNFSLQTIVSTVEWCYVLEVSGQSPNKNQKYDSTLFLIT